MTSNGGKHGDFGPTLAQNTPKCHLWWVMKTGCIERRSFFPGSVTDTDLWRRSVNVYFTGHLRHRSCQIKMSDNVRIYRCVILIGSCGDHESASTSLQAIGVVPRTWYNCRKFMYVRSIHFILNESNSTENTKNIFEILLENVRLKVF